MTNTRPFIAGEREYFGDLEEILLEEKGFRVVGPIDGITTKHPVWVVEKDVKEYIMKFNFDHPLVCSQNNILTEARYLQMLQDIPGIVGYVDSGTIRTNKSYDHEGEEGKGDLHYVIKELLPGPTLAGTVITSEMKKQMLETMENVHGRGVLYEEEVGAFDFVLDEGGRPVLVDLEYMRSVYHNTAGIEKAKDKIRLLGDVLEIRSPKAMLKCGWEYTKPFMGIFAEKMVYGTGTIAFGFTIMDALSKVMGSDQFHIMGQEGDYTPNIILGLVGTALYVGAFFIGDKLDS